MTDAPTDAPAAEEPAGPVPDPARVALLEALQGELGDALVGSQHLPGDLVIRVGRDAWRRTIETLKIRHGFDYFCFLSGIDWLKSPELSTRYEQVYGAGSDGEGASTEGEDAGAEGDGAYLTDRVAGGEGRFTVFVRLQNLRTKLGITVKADLDDVDPTVQSITDVFRGADWHEREAWEMFGFEFTGHPGLRHIYLPTEFEGHPLRKDFPLLARAVKPWPGLVDKEPIPGEDEEEEAPA